MNRNSVISGVVLIIIGIFFFLQKLDLPYMDQVSWWPLILIGIGLVFIFSSIANRKTKYSIFPGVIMLGIGIHFLGQDLYRDWPEHWAVYTFIVAIAFFAQYFNTRDHSWVPGLVLLAVSLFSTVLQPYWEDIPWTTLWPLILIIVGLLLLFRSWRK